MFHQLEGLAIDEDITLADLQGVLLAFARQMFGEATEVRLRPGYFPFTEPSVEVDVSCFRCERHRPAGRRALPHLQGRGLDRDPRARGWWTRTCSATWPRTATTPRSVQGFAFGMGIERIAMLVHQVPDLRMLFENDLRLLEQFGAGP